MSKLEQFAQSSKKMAESELRRIDIALEEKQIEYQQLQARKEQLIKTIKEIEEALEE